MTQTALSVKVEDQQFNSPLVGKFNAYNVVSAFLICQSLGFDRPKIAEALSKATGAGGRLERVQLENIENQPLVLVDYAHTPDALENVLSTLKNLKTETQNLHVIFGCGGDRDKTKRPKMAQIAEQYADLITVTSDNPRSEDPDEIIDEIMGGFSKPNSVRNITDRRQAIGQVISESIANSIILIAGKGHETYQEIAGTRHDFDDREVARKALSQRIGTATSGEAE
ncbi:MAG: cyanophycin synthetase [Balneolaceae bacterium]|nr:cyanophycin synthetase [Balneolaceae bacterium]